MIIGIVGAEAAKFTARGRAERIRQIRSLLTPGDTVVSGECHLGGVDIWAKEAALDNTDGRRKYQYIGFPPEAHAWEYYKARNIQIAEASEYLVCFAVDRLPPGYKAQGFEHFCYHCKTDAHVKSGGCWTVKYGRKIGVSGEVRVIVQ